MKPLKLIKTDYYSRCRHQFCAGLSYRANQSKLCSLEDTTFERFCWRNTRFCCSTVREKLPGETINKHENLINTQWRVSHSPLGDTWHNRPRTALVASCQGRGRIYMEKVFKFLVFIQWSKVCLLKNEMNEKKCVKSQVFLQIDTVTRTNSPSPHGSGTITEFA